MSQVRLESEINFTALRARIADFFGEKVAVSMCGPVGIDMAAVASVADADFEEDVEDSALTDYKLAGELFQQIASGSRSVLYPGKHMKAMHKNRTLPVLSAIMIEAGVKPGLIIKFTRYDSPSLDRLVYSTEDYLAIKTLFIGKDIDDCFKSAFGKLAWNYDERSATAHIVFETFKYAFSKLDEPSTFVTALCDIGTPDQLLLEQLNAYQENEKASGHHYSESWARNKFMDAATWVAPSAWIISGVDIETVIAATESRFKALIAVYGQDLRDEHVQELLTIRRARMLAGYPDLWLKYGVKAAHFLGCDLLKLYAWREEFSLSDNDYDAIFYHSYFSLALGLIRREGSDNGFPMSAMKILVQYAPDIMNVKNVVYTGARERAWYSRVKDISEVSGVLNEMYLKDIWHPLSSRDEMASMMSSEAKSKLVGEYFESGSQALLSKVLILIEKGDVDINDFIGGLKLKRHFVNLAKLIVPTAAQAEMIPLKYRKVFLNAQLDI